LFDEARVPPELDDGFVALAGPKDAKAFVEACRKLRHWPRELAVDLDTAPAPKR